MSSTFVKCEQIVNKTLTNRLQSAILILRGLKETAKGDDFIKRKSIKIVSVILAIIMTFSSGINAFAFDMPFGIPFFEQTEQLDEASRIASIMHRPIKQKEDFTFTADKITTNSAVLNWNSETLVLSYLVCKYNVINHVWEEYLTTNDNTLELKDLDEDSDYRFGIFNSVNMDGLGELTFTTGVKTASVSVTHYSSDSVELRIRHTDSVANVWLYRSTDGENYEKLAEVNDNKYIDTDVEQETTYYYRVKCVTNRKNKKNESKESRAVKATTLKGFELPEITGATKTYAYYRAVTAKSTPQYKLLNSEECYTDEETGIRMVDGFYCIALGSFYGTKIGTKYRITLQDGEELKELNCILCDQKADRHTDEKHQYAVKNKDIMEFYIEKSKRPHGIMGDYGHLEQFRGDIVKIEQYPDIEETEKEAE